MIVIEQQPATDELKKWVNQGLGSHAIEMTGFNEKFEPVMFVAYENGNVAGSFLVEKFWGALHIKYVYVDVLFRGRGIATQLMEKAIAYGKKVQLSFCLR